MSKVIDTKPLADSLRSMKDEEILSGFYKRKLQKVKDNGMYYIAFCEKTT